MKKYCMLILFLFLFFVIYVPTSHAASTNTINCDQYKNVKKVMWNGMELKAGQSGLLTVLKDTPLYIFNGKQKVFNRTLKKNGVYRIYTFKTGMLGLGGGFYVNRDSKVAYQTPSKTKLLAVKCIISNNNTISMSDLAKKITEATGCKVEIGDINSLLVLIKFNGRGYDNIGYERNSIYDSVPNRINLLIDPVDDDMNTVGGVLSIITGEDKNSLVKGFEEHMKNLSKPLKVGKVTFELSVTGSYDTIWW